MDMRTHDSDSIALSALLRAARPFLEITGVERIDWCRSVSSPRDARRGPWRYRAVYDVLDNATWNAAGEVIYFVVDAAGCLRLVGQSKDKLRTRWRTSPMHEARTMMPLGQQALFHSSTWPAIELAINSGERPPFLVSALFRLELEDVCRSCGGHLAKTLSQTESHLRKLSYHVESWVCTLQTRERALWNKQKV